jgi:hypothetical protein
VKIMLRLTAMWGWLFLVAGSASATTGGPDPFGYEFIDSLEPGGPAYAFDDISGTGQPLNLADDDDIGVPLGWDFPFYGQPKSAIRVSSNGAIYFTTSFFPYANSCINSAGSGPDEYIAPFWDDLNPSASGQVYAEIKTGPNRVIVQWDGVPRYGTTAAQTFQVVLFESGLIEMRYENMATAATSAAGNSATVGIRQSSTVGLQYSCNQGSLSNNLIVQYRACDASLDFDGDGFSDCDDCNDEDADTYPGAPDTCDGIDQGCDGVDGIDGDGDRYGECDDCDDANPNISPGIEERYCNQVDDDCNASTLDNPDIDRDGFFRCDDDCNDDDARINPRATEVLCNGVNEDCDASTPDEVD